MTSSKRFCHTILFIVVLVLEINMPGYALAQTPSATDPVFRRSVSEVDNIHRTEKDVPVPQVKSDKEIVRRLTKILQLTGWFEDINVASTEGVVTISGKVADDSQRDWAVKLAQDMIGVVAVISQIELKSTAWFDLEPTKKELKTIWKDSLTNLPHLVIAVVILILSLFAFRYFSGWVKNFWTSRLTNPLLSDLMGRIGALPILLLGLYMALYVLNLTGLAVTVLGGTGALGLVAGFAFKNILENYFSGIMLSVRRPFVVGDIIQVAGERGVVYSLNTRGTTLVDEEGHHIFVPNSTIITSIIKNQTPSPLTRIRADFAVPVKTSPETHKRRILEVIRTHSEIATDPAPQIRIVENKIHPKIEVFFWINVRATNADKLKLLLNTELVSGDDKKNDSLAAGVSSAAQVIPPPPMAKPISRSAN